MTTLRGALAKIVRGETGRAQLVINMSNPTDIPEMIYCVQDQYSCCMQWAYRLSHGIWGLGHCVYRITPSGLGFSHYAIITLDIFRDISLFDSRVFCSILVSKILSYLVLSLPYLNFPILFFGLCSPAQSLVLFLSANPPPPISSLYFRFSTFNTVLSSSYLIIPSSTMTSSNLISYRVISCSVVTHFGGLKRS